MTDPLHALFERFRQTGEVELLGELFDHAAPKLQRVAGHLARDVSEAEDLLQETFIAAMESADKYDPEHPVLPWLLGILSNQWRYRRRQAGRVIDNDRVRVDAPEPPDIIAEKRELTSVVMDAIRSLPSTYREVVEAHLVGGQRAVEVARELDRSAGTVRMQLMRGLDRLRQALPAGLAGSAVVVLPNDAFLAIRGRLLERASELRPQITKGVGSVAAAAAVATPMLGGSNATRLTFRLLLATGAVTVASVLAWAVMADDGSISPASWGQVIASPHGERSADTSSLVETKREHVPRSTVSVGTVPTPLIGEIPAIVVDPAGDPVPSAEVWFIDEGSFDRERAFWDEYHSGDADFAFVKQAHRCPVDENGALLLPKWRERARAFVTSKGLRAMCSLRVDSKPPVRLELLPTRALDVRVTNQGGEFAPNVPVEVLGEDGRQVAVTWTGDAGTAKIHVTNGRVGHGVPMRLGICVPLNEKVEIPFPTNLDEIVMLEMPSVGSAEVTLTLPDGIPLPSEVWIRVHQFLSSNDSVRTRRTHRVVTRDGKFRFPYLGVGTRLGLEYDGFLRSQSEADGPQAEGECVKIRTVLGAGQVFLMGRLVGPNGQSVAGSKVEIAFEVDRNGSSTTQRNRVSTDADGEFLLLSRFDDPEVLSRKMHVEVLSEAGEVWTCSRRLPVLKESGALDFGSLEVGERVIPPLVSGVVVDERGLPIMGAVIELQRGLGDNEAHAWLDLHEVDKVTAQQDGQFEFRADLEHKFLKVSARKQLYYGAEQVVQPGEGGVRLVMIRGAAMKGVVRLPKSLLPDRVIVELWGSGLSEEEKRGVMPCLGFLDASGEFHYIRIPRGAYDVRVLLRGCNEVLCERNGLEVRPLETLDLADLTVHGQFYCYDVEFEATAEKLQRAQLYYAWEGELSTKFRRAPGGARRIGLVYLDKPTAKFASRQPSVEVIAWALGHVPQRVSLVPGKQKVQLEPLR